MRRGRGCGWRVFCLVWGLAAGSAHWAGATTVVPETRTSLLGKAPIIVHGKVVQMEVHPTTGQRTAIVEAFEVAKGAEVYKRQRDFYIPLLNRAIPHRDLVQVVPAAPELALGDEVVVFLRPWPEDSGRADGRPIFALEGFHQGKYRVVSDARGVRKVAAWDELPDRPLNPAELQTQKTSVRIQRGASKGPVESPAVVDKLESLDSLLNAARAVGSES